MTDPNELALKEKSEISPALPKAKTSKKCPVFYTSEADKMNAQVQGRCGEEQEAPEDVYKKRLLELTGTENKELAEDIVNSGFFSIVGSDISCKRNIVVQSLADQQPRDAHEARLCVQAAALYSQGMDFLDRARRVLFDETMAKDHWHTILMKTATRLLDLHNRTIEALMRYRQQGEQRIVVQHVTVQDGGKAIVGGMLNGGGGNQQ